MKLSMPLILGSASPRRKELLTRLGIEFSVVVADIDETPLPDELPRMMAERLAEEKSTGGQRLTEPICLGIGI